MKLYKYDEFVSDILKLATLLKDKNYDTIITIARGGLMPTHALSQALNIRHIQSIDALSYEQNVQQNSLVFNPARLDLSSSKKVLVIDDISDSGKTLSAIMAHLEQNFKEIEFESATLFYKKTSIYEPTYFVQIAEDWVDFFWERDFRL